MTQQIYYLFVRFIYKCFSLSCRERIERKWLGFHSRYLTNAFKSCDSMTNFGMHCHFVGTNRIEIGKSYIGDGAYITAWTISEANGGAILQH